MKCCSKQLHNISKDGIYKITNGDMVQKWNEFFRLAPELLFSLIILLFMVKDFDSIDTISKNGEKKKFVLSRTHHNNYEEGEKGK